MKISFAGLNAGHDADPGDSGSGLSFPWALENGPTLEEPLPVGTFEQWCWLGRAHDVASFSQRLDRFPGLNDLPGLRVERSLDDAADRLANDWSYHALIEGERTTERRALPATAFAPGTRGLWVSVPNADGTGHHLMLAGVSGRGKDGTSTLVLNGLRAGRSTWAMNAHAEVLFTPEDLQPCQRTVTLDAWLLRHDRVDLLEVLVERSGGWTPSRYRAALDGLCFLHLPLRWSDTVQRWAEGAELHLALPEATGQAPFARRRL